MGWGVVVGEGGPKCDHSIVLSLLKIYSTHLPQFIDLTQQITLRSGPSGLSTSFSYLIMTPHTVEDTLGSSFGISLFYFNSAYSTCIVVVWGINSFSFWSIFKWAALSIGNSSNFAPTGLAHNGSGQKITLHYETSQKPKVLSNTTKHEAQPFSNSTSLNSYPVYIYRYKH